MKTKNTNDHYHEIRSEAQGWTEIAGDPPHQHQLFPGCRVCRMIHKRLHHGLLITKESNGHKHEYEESNH